MVHKPFTQQALPFFKIGSEGEQMAVKSIPVVVFAPKYDEKLREEFEIEINEEGRIEVRTTRIGQRNVSDFVGEFDNYEDAREVLFSKFDQDFNRPSEMAIKHGGRSPMERVWDYTEGGRQVKASISMVEGSKSISVVQVQPKVVTIKVRKAPPFIITIHEMHPKYFEKVRERHQMQLGRLQRMRRKGFSTRLPK